MAKPELDAETQKRFDKENAQREYFFHLIGQIVTQWAYVDAALFDFFEWSLSIDKRKAATLYYRTQTIGDHLTLVDTMLELSIENQDLIAEWKKIYKKIEAELPLRNDVAHNPAIATTYLTAIRPSKEPVAVPFEAPPPRTEWAIRTEDSKLLAHSKKRKTRQRNAKDKELIDHIRSTVAFRMEMIHFLKRLQSMPPVKS